MTNYVKLIPELNESHVVIKNPDELNVKISNLIEAGHGKLQIISDFDKTITKQHDHGKPHLSSFAIFSKCPSLSQEFLATVSALTKKYGSIEIDPSVPRDKKTVFMEEWWTKTEIAFKTIKVSQKEIEEICLTFAPALRDGTKQFFNDLCKHNVPALVLSAGLGDVVVFVLKQSQVLLPNVEVVSNFIRYDDNGAILGFKENLIHVYNKNEYAIKGTDFYNKIISRDNVIILGDSLGDADMAEGMDHLSNVLKIGFLYERMDEALPSYMDAFDIVLKDDQTMDVPRAILRLIDSKTELGTN